MTKANPQETQSAATRQTKRAAPTLAASRKPGRRAAARARAETAAGVRVQATSAAPRKPRTRGEAPPSGTVTMQARVDADFARELVEADAPVLGLDGISALVREGLRLVHRQARELAMAREYDEFYGGEPAPLPEGVAAVWDE
jgi:hypothetical protein